MDLTSKEGIEFIRQTQHERSSNFTKISTPPNIKKSKIKINDINCFIIQPDNDDLLPLIYYIHAGGFFMPAPLYTLENAIYYADKLNCRIIMPDYSLMPDYIYPTQLCECLNTLKTILENHTQFNIDYKKVVLYGDSAGGCLAAVISQIFQDSKYSDLLGELLIFPCCDNNYQKYESYNKYTKAFFSSQLAKSMWKMYLKDVKDYNQKFISPMNNNNLDKVVQTYIEAEEYDIFFDEAVMYAKKLKQNNVSTVLNKVAGSYHAVDQQRHTNFVKDLLDYRIRIIKSMLDNTFSKNL